MTNLDRLRSQISEGRFFRTRVQFPASPLIQIDQQFNCWSILIKDSYETHRAFPAPYFELCLPASNTHSRACALPNRDASSYSDTCHYYTATHFYPSAYSDSVATVLHQRV